MMGSLRNEEMIQCVMGCVSIISSDEVGGDVAKPSGCKL